MAVLNISCSEKHPVLEMPSHGGSSSTQLLANDVPKPRPFCKGMNTKLHLQAVENYLRQLKVTDDKVKFDVLLNTLEENCQFEIFSLLDYDETARDSKWLSKTIQRLFGEKESQLTNMMRLLTIKQKPKQKLNDYISEIRVEAFKIFGTDDKEAREKHMIMAFISGLQSQKASLILKEMNLKTLDECYCFIKENEAEVAEDVNSVQEENQVNDISQMDLYEKRIRSLESVVRQLKEKLDALLRNKNYPNRQGKKFVQRNDGACYNCGKKGHIAKFCYSRRQRVVNNIAEEDSQDYAASSSSQSDHGDDIEDDVTAVEVTHGRTKNTKKFERKRVGRCTDRSIVAWTQYVEGQGGKPKISLKKESSRYTPTIVDNKSQTRNKALVLCQIEGRATKVLFDTGATQNVISAELYREISGSKNLKIRKTNRSLKCANNSKLTCVGNVILNIQIGRTGCKKIFTVVEDLSQKAIIGIRGMKASNIIVDAGKNGILCNNEFLKFVGKIAAPTIIAENW